ncbi:unnamed protein product [Hydatigera taeniaeformis]|uniref:G protein-coupled receptor n=1 Tax=Hydatigena taeniaeformis TaxID=6205 RepID=A0A0R3X5V0_HYDTA|nr:unnamed protein product [Hydatigera taeniaeformis]
MSGKASVSRLYLEHWQTHGGLNVPPPPSQVPVEFPLVSGYWFAVVAAAIGILLNISFIIHLLLKKYTPFAWFAIGKGCCDLLACFFYALGEIYRIVHNSLRRRWMGCEVVISKPAFWVFFAIRMALMVMEAWYLFTRLVFPSVYRRHGGWIILGCIFSFFIGQAIVANFVHSLTAETGRHMLCFETMDMFRLYNDGTGSQKLAIAHHIAMAFIVPLLFTHSIYTNVLNVLIESPSATHLLSYNSVQQMYFMDNLLPVFVWSPFFFLFFVFHFGTYLHFSQATVLHRITFGAGLTYHAFYPLLCAYFRRDVGGHLMGGLDVSHGHWAKNEQEDRGEFYGLSIERVAQPWSSSTVRPLQF